MNAIGGIYRPETRRGILSSPTAYITLSFQLVHITEYRVFTDQRHGGGF